MLRARFTSATFRFDAEHVEILRTSIEHRETAVSSRTPADPACAVSRAKRSGARAARTAMRVAERASIGGRCAMEMPYNALALGLHALRST